MDSHGPAAHRSPSKMRVASPACRPGRTVAVHGRQPPRRERDQPRSGVRQRLRRRGLDVRRQRQNAEGPGTSSPTANRSPASSSNATPRCRQMRCRAPPSRPAKNACASTSRPRQREVNGDGKPLSSPGVRVRETQNPLRIPGANRPAIVVPDGAASPVHGAVPPSYRERPCRASSLSARPATTPSLQSACKARMTRRDALGLPRSNSERKRVLRPVVEYTVSRVSPCRLRRRASRPSASGDRTRAGREASDPSRFGEGRRPHGVTSGRFGTVET